MGRYKIWINDKDDNGRPLDEDIVKAARQIGPALVRYRRKGIDCDSTVGRTLQSAVETASRAARRKPIENPAGYLRSVYKRSIDRLLEHQQRLVPVDDDFLEDLTSSAPAASFEEVVHNRLLIEKLLKSMDPETRRICSWKLQGFSMREIARKLNVTANCLSVRYSRGLKNARIQAFGPWVGEIHDKRQEAVQE